MQRHVFGIAAALLVGAAGIAKADVIDNWTHQLLDTIRATGGPPAPISRNGAIFYVGIFDAVNSIDRSFVPYVGHVTVPGPANKEAAISAAAHKILVELYPDRQPIFFDQHMADLAALPNDTATANGILVGEAAAEQILAHRAGDLTDVEFPYTYINQPGWYRPTAPDFTEPPFTPGWGSTQPWTMSQGAQFRGQYPNKFRRMERLLRSPGYARQLNEVKAYGDRFSTVRTPEQTEIAWFWANDRDGTFKPPGHLYAITMTVANDQGLSLEEKVHLHALVGLALGDAAVVAWDMKYNLGLDLWRPISAIREANTDGNPRTQPDPDWLPLLDFSPPFPAYTSGHATFGAAHAAVMRSYFGTDNITFTVGTDEPIVSDVTRTFHSFSEAALENGASRLYLGVHYRFDADIAYVTGTRLGEHVPRYYLRKMACLADVNGKGGVNAADLKLFTRWFINGHPRADLNGDHQVDNADFLLFLDSYFGGGCN